MTVITKQAEISKHERHDGGIELRLIVEGETRATASAKPEEVEAMTVFLGKTREEIEDELATALEDYFNDELEKVELHDLQAEDEQPLKFYASYVYRAHDDILEGLVWYDVRAGTTGPEDAEAIVKNRLRSRVHDRLSQKIRQ